MVKYMVAFDGTNTSALALKHVEESMNKEEDEIYVIGVAEEQREVVVSPYAVPYTLMEEVNQHRREVVKKMLVEQLKKLKHEKNVKHVHAIEGFGTPAFVIIEQAKKYKIDFLVMGRRGDVPLLDEIFLGSVSSHCVKHAKCSVMLVKQDHPEESKFIVAVDGSDHSEKALVAAKSLLRGNDSVELVTVVKDSDDATAKIHGESVVSKQKQFAVSLGISEEKLTTKVLEEADPRMALVQEAEIHPNSVLVVGTRGLNKIQRMVLGSTSIYAVEHSNINIVVAR